MKKLLPLLLLPLFLAACGERVEVPPAHVGKILTNKGYKPDTVPPSKFRLDPCWAYCDKLVLLEVSDRGKEETFRLFMPKDNLNLAFDIRFTLAIPNDEAAISQLYDRVPPAPTDSGIYYYIDFDRAYQTYGKPVLREIIRTTVANYAIDEIMANRERINAELFRAVTEALEGTPLYIKRLGFGDVQPPDIIVKAQEAAAERRIEIEKAEAQKQVRLVELERELEEARAQRNIRKERAQAILEENDIIAKSVTPDYLAYRQLEVLEFMAKNRNTVFVPFEALGTLGLQQRVFHQEKR